MIRKSLSAATPRLHNIPNTPPSEGLKNGIQGNNTISIPFYPLFGKPLRRDFLCGVKYRRMEP